MKYFLEKSGLTHMAIVNLLFYVLELVLLFYVRADFSVIDKRLWIDRYSLIIDDMFSGSKEFDSRIAIQNNYQYY